MTVDEFVKTKVLPEHRESVEIIRRLMHEMAPDIQEVIFRGIPAFKRKQVLAVISPTRRDITLAFSRGAEFKDEYGLLHGVGKVSRHIKIKGPDINPEAIRYYIQQALDMDN